jgi:hypothetical protein
MVRAQRSNVSPTLHFDDVDKIRDEAAAEDVLMNVSPQWSRLEAAPSEVPFVEIKEGRISFDFGPLDTRSSLFNFRWEVDARQSGDPPLEDWLRGWWSSLGYSPAHPPSHLHFNSQLKPSSGRSQGLDEPAENSLRLALGDPNTIAFLLSVAAWVRRNCRTR